MYAGHTKDICGPRFENSWRKYFTQKEVIKHNFIKKANNIGYNKVNLVLYLGLRAVRNAMAKKAASF